MYLLSNVYSINRHILSYHPVISHYNRKNAPHCRYLDSNLNQSIMWNDYNEKAEVKISFSTYSSYFKKLNIGFKKPGCDGCPDCLFYEYHIALYKSEV